MKNMMNENLGAICNAHVVRADLSEYGALDEACLDLAERAATAVDFPKTGKHVTLPSHLKPKMYPDFMGKEEFLSYKSNKILGKMYRRIKDVYSEDVTESSEQTINVDKVPYDEDLEIPGSADFINDAWIHKCSYDCQLNGLLGQYKVKREGEVVTGHVWSMPKYNSNKQWDLKERLKNAYHSMKGEFREIFEKMNSDFDELNDDEKSRLYEQKASAWYQVTYHPTWVKKSLELQDPDEATGESVLLSFAWIPVDYLARIKIRRKGIGNADSSKPIDSLARFLVDRI